MNAQARLGLFVLLALALLVIFSSRIGGFQWGEEHGLEVNVLFNDASGIAVQTPVMMAGVQIGEVATIALKDNQALVTLRIQSDIQLPASTRAEIAGGGLVGEKYIALQASPGDKQPLANATIPSSSRGDFGDMIGRASELTEEATRFFDKAEQVTDSVQTIINENRQDIRATTRNMAQLVQENRPELKRASHDLAGILHDNRKNVDRLMHSLPGTADAARKFFDQSSAAMRDFHELVIDNRENLYRTLFELRVASENLEAFSDDIRRNPWKIMKEKPEVKADRRKRQKRMEEMLMTTGRMGITPR